MILKIIVSAGLLISSNFLHAQDEMIKSTRVSSPVKIDGKANDWPAFHLYDNSSKLFFAFSNDDKNLFICFQSSDEMNQAKITRAGMKINLSVKTSDKHKVAINFPLGQNSETTKLAADKKNDGDAKSSKQEHRNNFFAQNTMMDIKGFVTKDGMITINDSSGINAAINWDDNDKLTYEIAIPFKEFYGAGYTPEDLLKPVSIDAEVDAIKNKGHGSYGGGQGFGARGGRGGRGGRMGGGGGGHRQENAETADEKIEDPTAVNRDALFEKGELKEKFILATSAN